MFRTLYSRMMAVHLAVSLFILMVLGVALTVHVEQQNISFSTKELLTEAQEIVRLMENRSVNGGVLPDEPWLDELLESASRRTGSIIWVVGQSGQMQSLSATQTRVRQQLDLATAPRLVTTVLGGQAQSSVSKLDGRFVQNMLAIGVPFHNPDKTSGGGVFLLVPFASLRSAYLDIYWMVWFTTFCSFLLGGVLTAYLSSRITKPLREIGEAAEAIAQGDFRRRVEAASGDEIGKLAGSFNAMAEELSRLDDMRKGFVANVSHELRAPMTSIQGFVQAIMDGAVPPQDHNKYLGIVLDESKRLSKMVGELLALSQMDAGQYPLDIQPFELCELIRRVMIKYDVKLEQRKLQLVADFDTDPAFVMADSDKIEQVVGNLLDNAIRFTPENGEIRIRVYCEKDKVYTSVSDSGAGISQEDLPYIWDRFYTADKAHTSGSGTGLGLSIVRSIVEEHGERIIALSPQDQGAIFIFSLAHVRDVAVDHTDNGEDGDDDTVS